MKRKLSGQPNIGLLSCRISVYLHFRIESDILKIKAEMDSMEKQLTGLMTKSEIGTSQKAVRKFINKDSPPELSLPCPRCPVCDELMMPPLHIYQECQEILIQYFYKL